MTTDGVDASRVELEFAQEMEKVFDNKRSENEVERHWCKGVVGRRKRRRKRRRDLECLEHEKNEKHVFFNAAKKQSYLTPKEEAKFSWYLKVVIPLILN